MGRNSNSLYLVAIACSIGLILASIFPWRGFDPTGHWHRIGWVPFMSRPVRAIDVVGNLILFMPLGASIALHARRAALGRTAIVAFVFSFFGEWAQIYSRYRYPSGGDLILNVAGAVAAAYGFDQLRRHWMQSGSRSSEGASEVRSRGVGMTYSVPAAPALQTRGRAGVN
jgi:glycopeptide antibiotics resistance protein